MKTMLFHEYMNSKGKVDKPVVKLDGDRLDPNTMPNKLPQGGKPYSMKDSKAKKGNKRLADQGDSDLKYTPKVDNDSKGKAPVKIPTVDEVALASKVASAVAKDPTFMETIVRHLKSKGLLGALVAEMLNHRETYNHISEVMAHEAYGPDLCNKLVRAMKEEVAAPFSDQLDDKDEEDPSDLENGDQSDGEGLDDENELGLDDEEGDDLDVDATAEDEEGEEGGDGMNMDPDMDGMGMDPMMGMGPGMDPNMMGQMDPSMMGMNPSMMGQMNPAMMQNPAMMNFQRAMMKAFMRKMMGKA